MFQKVINFIKYHNAFTIALAFVLFLTAGAFASSDKLIGEKVETIKGIDNSFVLSADLENFNPELKIEKIEEDEDNYYVSYSYTTIAIVDNVWQPFSESKTLVVSKAALAGTDLGLFAAQELSETIDYDLSYLKEVQKIEQQKGLTKKTATTKYSGLVGRILKPKEKVFAGYSPVIPPPKKVVVEKKKPPVDEGAVRETIARMPVVPKGTEYLNKEPVGSITAHYCDQGYAEECTDPEECQAAGLYWYKGDCHYGPEGTEDVKPIAVLGCTDSTASNYNYMATEDDGSCKYAIAGCMDKAALNYNPKATSSDNSCEYPVSGCTDESALNYSSEATIDDGSCEFEESIIETETPS